MLLLYEDEQNKQRTTCKSQNGETGICASPKHKVDQNCHVIRNKETQTLQVGLLTSYSRTPVQYISRQALPQINYIQLQMVKSN